MGGVFRAPPKLLEENQRFSFASLASTLLAVKRASWFEQSSPFCEKQVGFHLHRHRPQIAGA